MLSENIRNDFIGNILHGMAKVELDKENIRNGFNCNVLYDSGLELPKIGLFYISRQCFLRASATSASLAQSYVFASNTESVCSIYIYYIHLLY